MIVVVLGFLGHLVVLGGKLLVEGWLRMWVVVVTAGSVVSVVVSVLDSFH